MIETQRYYYAVMRERDIDRLKIGALEATPIAGDGGLQTQFIGELTIVFSETTEHEVMSTRRNMLKHTRILEMLMASGPILPFRFGVIGPQQGGVQTAIEARSVNLLSQLNDLDGRHEVGIRISWDKEQIMKRIVSDDPSLTAAHAALQGRSETETHYERIELGRRVHDALAARRMHEAEEISSKLASLSIQSKTLDVHDDMGILNAAYLVDLEHERKIVSEVERLDATFPDLYRIRILSPTPPFNFVSIDLSNIAKAA